MSPFRNRVWLLCLLWVSSCVEAAVHHALDVVLSPDRSYIEATDTISLSSDKARELEFVLHPGLKPVMLTRGVVLTAIGGAAEARLPALNNASGSAGPAPSRYRVELPSGQTRFVLRYHGHVQHELQQGGEEYARGFRETPGTITGQGVFLAGRSFWYPYIADELMTFDLSLQLPQDWYGMSQGERVARESGTEYVREQWRCESPQEEIYLIAGQFTEYVQADKGVHAMVFLRQPDQALAQKYLDATIDYVRLYTELIGPYPYKKFALVENFWETGYGMPSFTLLGQKVIRFPFILHSSYPHEILHNWWGNGVYVDYDRGNWAEGLTSYLADHLIKEQRGQGVEYRRNTLQKYSDHVRKQVDFPLTEFRSRHSAVSEAVGYGKTLMLFHMLRNELGDERFTRGLRTLYIQNRFRIAGFSAVEDAFSEVAGKPLHEFFTQWVQRRGAPQLQLSQVSARPQEDGFVLSAVIEQVQDEAPYVLRVPLAIQLEDRQQAWQTTVRLDGKRNTIGLELPARPLQLDVDPQFDVFRRLHRNETPPAISQLLGSERILVVLSEKEPEGVASAYETLARAWEAGQPARIEVVVDTDLEQLPGDRGIWLLGWQNRFRPLLDRALADYGYADRGTAVKIQGTSLGKDEHAIVALGRRPGNPDQALGLLAAGQAAALPGLGRKLPHYGKYSYLAFRGEEPQNVLKGQWPVLQSPLSAVVVQDDGMPVTPGTLQLAPRRPLVTVAAEFSVERMQRDIAWLSDVSMEGRGLGTPLLDRAAGYIAEQLRAAGLQPGAKDGNDWLQVWEAQVPELGKSVTLANVIGILPGSDPARAGESLVIGAHYDHLGRGEYGAHGEDRGRIHPGADDNASGVAVLLELARALAGKSQPRTIVFVAFTGEETERLGSKHFLRNASRYPVDQMIAMVNLDSVGRLDERPLLALGAGTAEEWVHILRGAEYVTGVQVKPVADDIGSSDQTSFIEAGVPAVQLFGGVHEDFHRPGDTVDKIDTGGLVKTARVLKEIATYLAGRPEALNSGPGMTRQNIATPSTQGKRRVSLGIVPDYAVSGEGVRIAEVRARTPAAQAGLRAGDIISAVNATAVHNLRDYTRALKKLAPGDAVTIVYRRNEIEHRATTRVVER
ncbi:MAG: M20/M25/M40 family metallo-hydrolase [Gammaproteobacteria bacterium]|nr:MAG: M20/M25/M40 family metallo-hydrolase [Gammaproteobacteria bacterium]